MICYKLIIFAIENTEIETSKKQTIMKNRLLLMLFATVVFTACDNEDEGLWTHDIPGFEARIIVLDKEGNNLMDPNCENNIIGEISATYNGVTYECEDLFGIYEKPETETRVAYTPFLGLYNAEFKFTPYVGFGPFDGHTEYDNETVTIDLGNGIQHTMSVSNKVKINGKHVNIKRSVTCDGKEAVDTLGITDVFVFIR